MRINCGGCADDRLEELLSMVSWMKMNFRWTRSTDETEGWACLISVGAHCDRMCKVLGR
jgi:hypothetical protein